MNIKSFVFDCLSIVVAEVIFTVILFTAFSFAFTKTFNLSLSLSKSDDTDTFSTEFDVLHRKRNMTFYDSNDC